MLLLPRALCVLVQCTVGELSLLGLTTSDRHAIYELTRDRLAMFRVSVGVDRHYDISISII